MKRISLILSLALLTSANHLQSQDLTPTQQAYIKASNTGVPTPGETFGNNQNFGWSVSIAGDTMVIGAPYENSGATGVNGNLAQRRLIPFYADEVVTDFFLHNDACVFAVGVKAIEALDGTR